MKVMKAHQSKLQLGKTTIRTMDKEIRTASYSIKGGLTASVIGEEENGNDRDTDAGVFWQNRRRYLQRDRRNKTVKTNSYQNAVSEYRLPDTVKAQRQHKSVAFYESTGNGTVSQGVHVSTQAASSRTASSRAASMQTASTRTASMQTATQTASMQAASSQAAISTVGNTMMQGTVTASKYAASTGAKAAAKGTAATAGAASGAATAGATTGVVVVGEAVKKVKRMEERMREALTAAIIGSQVKTKGKKSRMQEQTEIKENQTGGTFAIWGVVSLILFLFMIMFTLSFALVGGFSELAQAEETDIIEVAKKELEVSEENIGGYKYKSWYGMDENWCAMFVSWCANECGYIEAEIMPKTASVAEMQRWYISHELYRTKASGYIPKRGDIIIFKNGTSHVGIVISYDMETKMITTIEGNTGSSEAAVYHKGSCVKKRKYALTNTHISGYGTPEYDKTEETDAEEEEEDNADTDQ